MKLLKNLTLLLGLFLVILCAAPGAYATTVALDAGSTTAFTASDGTVYAVDTYYTSSVAYLGTNVIAGTTDDGLYQSYRANPAFTYSIPIANGTYNVTLKFCENAPYNTAGVRVMNVSLQGTQVLSNFDIYVAGGNTVCTAVDRSFTASVTGGVMTIALARVGTGSYACISAIKIVSSNNPPSSNAGTDQTITLPTSSVTLSGSGSDTDGTISSYAWTKVSGGAATITSPSSASTSVTGLTAGTYTFRLTVTDNGGAVGTDDVQVIVNIAPSANAGTDQTITLPTSSVTLSGSASDADGSISSYAWTKVSGGAATITSPSSASTTVTGLTAGVYTFRLTATDNRGATGTDNVQVTVNSASSSATWTAIAKNTVGNTNNGYYEFLPSAYYNNPTQKLPIVFMFHGAGETGSGSVADLAKVIGYGPGELINTPSEPLHGIFDANNVIVLCPQSATTPWSNATISNFMTYAFSHYSGHIDTRRIYMSGLSYGCTGVNSFIELNPSPDQATSFLVCAYRDQVTSASGFALAKYCNYWALSSQDDWSSHPDQAVDGMAAAIASPGSAPAGVLTTFPGGGFFTVFSPNVNTANYVAGSNSWSWVSNAPGVNAADATDGVNPKLTVYTGGAHNSWDRTYHDGNIWNWLWNQQKPDVTVSSPTANQSVTVASSLALSTSNAKDASGTNITGSHVQWYTSTTGNYNTGTLLGTGTSYTVPGGTLSTGTQYIMCVVTDSKYHGTRVVTTIVGH